MVDYFVADYKPVASFILAMLVVAELKKSRIGPNRGGKERAHVPSHRHRALTSSESALSLPRELPNP